MNLYEQIKTHITPKHVTERYGPPIHRGNMICCRSFLLLRLSEVRRRDQSCGTASWTDKL